MGVAISSAAAAASFALSEKLKASVLDYVMQPHDLNNVLEKPDSKVAKIKQKKPTELLDMIRALEGNDIN